MTSRSSARRRGRQKGLATVRDSLSAISFDRRWLVAGPVALILAGAVGFNSFAHISKTAGACPIRYPAFCSSRALQAPVTRDLGRDSKLDDRAQTVRLARTAIDMGAVNPVAIRNLALASTVDAKALQLMRLADRLSRRDGVTEAWLIEEAARRGDLSTTLSHFDALLRTMPAASARFMQQMGLALGDPKFRKAMIPYANLKNPWFGSLGAAIMSGEPSVRFYGQYLAEVPALPDSEQQRRHYDEVLSRLAREGQYDVVRRLYPRLPGADRSAMASAGLPAPKQMAYRPITWALQSDGAVGAEMARGDKPELVVYAESGASGGVASKLMFLGPGRYRLSWRTVNEASDETGPTNTLDGAGVSRTEPGGLFWTISCPGLQGTELATASAERTDGKGRPVAVDFDVPAGCTAQNLALQARIDSSASGVQWTLSDLSVRPVAAARP